MRFGEFWVAWPKNSDRYTRKGCKSECERRWQQRGLDLEADHIIAHVEWLKGTEDWQKQGGAFIPAPLVYLNQSRWDGAEIPESPQQIASRAQAVYEQQLAASIAAMQRRPNSRAVSEAAVDALAVLAAAGTKLGSE